MSRAYLMEHAGEGQRLEAKTDEEMSKHQLTLAGLREGMRALDAGAGTGAVSRTMATIVGAAGHVVALDRSAERIHEGRRAAEGISNLEFVGGDVLSPPLGEASFDFVWSRFLLEYLDDPDAALAVLTKLTRPGGIVVAGDLDGHGLFHYPVARSLSEGFERIVRVLDGHFDPYAGRKLYDRFFRLGAFQKIDIHVLSYHLYAGAADEGALANWRAKFATIRPVGKKAFANEGAYDAFVEDFLAHLVSPSTFTYAPLILAVGRKAA